MSDVLKSVADIRTPLAIAALAVVVLLLVLREILRKKIFPTLTKGHSFALLNLIVDRIFKVVLAVVVCGFVAFLAEALLRQMRYEAHPRTAAELYRILEGVENAPSERLEALRTLRDELGVRDFRRRNFSGLVLPSSGWQGVDLLEANLRAVKLRNGNLRGVDMKRAILVGADVSGTDFREAELNGADLTDANCSDANFREVWLRAGVYRRANFSRARLDFANMQVADFADAKFDDADFSSAEAQESVFRGADLSRAQRLDSAYLGSSHFDAATRFPPGFSAATHGMIRDN